MVNDDADTTSSLAADSGFLELGKGETTAFPNLAVVPDSLSTNSRTQELEGANAKGSGFSLARLATAELASGLVEPSAHAQLPVLPEVVGVKD